jgi:hypothetical protein
MTAHSAKIFSAKLVLQFEALFLPYLGKGVKRYDTHKLDKDYEALGNLLNGRLCTNCIRDIILLSLREIIALPSLTPRLPN